MSVTASYKIVFYVPATHVERVKDAMFDKGAGQQGHYDRCCWQVLGEGQFRPLPGSDPFIGQESKHRGSVESVIEYRVEMLCEKSHLTAAIQALIDTHPYEEPAYDIFLTQALP